jgi:hypothetical protein
MASSTAAFHLSGFVKTIPSFVYFHSYFCRKIKIRFWNKNACLSFPQKKSGRSSGFVNAGRPAKFGTAFFPRPPLPEAFSRLIFHLALNRCPSS